MSQTFTIKVLAQQTQLSEEEVLKTLVAAGVIKKGETVQSVGDRQFTPEAIEGFYIVRDYFSNKVIAEGDYEAAAKQFQKYLSEKAEVAKQAVSEGTKKQSNASTKQSKSSASNQSEAEDALSSSSMTVSNGASPLTLPAGAQSFNDDKDIKGLLRKEASNLSEDFVPAKALAHVTEGIIERSQQAEEYYRNYGRQLFDDAVAEKSQKKISVEEAEEIIAETKKKYGL
jgi:hypothetical protein